MIRILLFISGFLIFNAHADISISSPKLKFNNQDERIIEFRINDEKIQDDDIVIKAYKSDDILEYQDFAYLILKNYEDYQILEIIIDNKFEENYFSFRIEISNEVSKDIFVFLFQIYFILLHCKCQLGVWICPLPLWRKGTLIREYLLIVLCHLRKLR